jgi:hypothetical protein
LSRTGNRAIRAYLLAGLAPAAFVAALAHAYPEGAPWGAANPSADENCASCHYDYEAQRDSPALQITGLPETAEADSLYELVVHFTGVEARVSGFQLIATSSGGSAGVFETGRDDIEAIGSASRSTRPAIYSDGACWTLRWRTPKTLGNDVQMFLAASAANDDQSPFGDTIHYRTFVIPVRSGR